MPVSISATAVLCTYALALGETEWKTTTPFTYNIDYSVGHVDNPDYIRRIAEAPPTLMHVGEDVVFSGVFGTKEVFGGPQRTHTKLITAEQAREKIRTLQRYTAAMHEAGVRWVVPYINNHTILGDHAKRIGFFEFFDHWDRFREFGFGPKPDEDILAAEMSSGFPRPKRYPEIGKDDPNYPYRRYALCTNHPIWRNYLLAVTRNIAVTGMDGVFADEMTLRDYCAYCRRGFADYLRRRYSESERRRRFGRAEVDSLGMGRPGDGALWYDSQAFWSYSNGQFLRALWEEGRKVRPDFFVMANLGPFAHIDGVLGRTDEGKDPQEWAPYSKLIMFEEMQRPGRLAPGVYVDNILQFKLAFGMSFVGGTLLYYAQEAPGIELSMAEAGAGGGGAFIEGGYREPNSRRKYRQFFESHSDLFDGYESQADIAVLFDYSQAYWGNHHPLWTTYPLSQYLSERHLLYDVIPPSKAVGARLSSRYKIVVTPGLRYLSGELLAALRGFAGDGGLWLDLGESGRFDDVGRVRERPPEPREERIGTGLILRRDELQEVLCPPRFALYLLREREANDLPEIMRLYEATRAPGYRHAPCRENEDLRMLLESVAGGPLVVLPGQGLEGLRCNVWRKKDGDRTIVTAHFVNYDSPIPTRMKLTADTFELGGPPQDHQPRVARDATVRLTVGPGGVDSVTAYDPDMSRVEDLRYSRTSDTVEFTLPPVRIYKIIRVVIRQAQARE